MADEKNKQDQDGIVRVKIADLNLDRDNANIGTERGEYMLGYSLENYGAGRSIVVDKNKNVIAGNKTLRKWAEMGAEEVVLIPNDGGKVLVGVLRDDLDLYDEEDPRGRQLAYADNRVGQINLHFDPEQVARDVESGLDLSGMFYDDELDEYEQRSDPEYLDMSQFGIVTNAEIAYRIVIDDLTREEAETLRESMPDSRMEMYRKA